MIDPFSAAIVLGAIGIGYVAGRVRKPAVRTEPPPRPICACSHSFGEHDEIGKCLGEIKRPSKWDKDGYEAGYTYVPCACGRYTGPVPLPSMWIAPVLVDEASMAALDRPAAALPATTRGPGLPAPKGYMCPACQHGLSVHREHGCDMPRCECPVPYGQLAPGDSEPQPGKSDGGVVA